MSPSSKPSLAVITGAAGGLGSALCQTLLDLDWHVLGIDHNSARLESLAARLDPNTFRPLCSDLENPDLTSEIDSILPELPPVRALACLAAQSRGNDILRLTDDDWHASFEINVTPAMRLARLLAPRIITAGGGSILNVGSPVGIVGARKPSYAASKAALTGLTMSLARNLGPENIRANLLLPGPMITPLTEDWPHEKRRAIAGSSFLKRLCQPEETARVAAFLLSDDASYITGAVIDATAGSMFGH